MLWIDMWELFPEVDSIDIVLIMDVTDDETSKQCGD